jgi:carbonic anhydrase/acetyltransferase-like protein (isoleucine patch superfamily)
MPIVSFAGKTPRIHPDAFVAPNAIVIGDVEIGPGASVWYGVILRGDVEPIRIGARTNVQDGSVIHTDRGHATLIGDEATIGHMACVHGCTVGARSLIGISATVLTGAVLAEDCVVGAGALVPEGKSYEPRSLLIGVPAKRVREVTPEEAARFTRGMEHYVENGRRHREALRLAGLL